MSDIEQPNVFVLMSPELVERLKDWSEPVQIKVDRSPDGRYELTARRVETEVAK